MAIGDELKYRGYDFVVTCQSLENSFILNFVSGHGFMNIIVYVGALTRQCCFEPVGRQTEIDFVQTFPEFNKLDQKKTKEQWKLNCGGFIFKFLGYYSQHTPTKVSNHILKVL